MIIYLARHGQNEDNKNGILNGHRDYPLTDFGKQQAQELAQKMVKLDLVFEEIYSSPLIRAKQTAEIVAESFAMEIEIMQDLIERDFGIMTGHKQSEITEMCRGDIFQTATIDYFLSPEGAETFDQLKERGKRVIEQVESLHSDDESVLLVSHGDIGKMIFAAYHDLDWREVLPQFHFGNSDLIKLAPDTPPENSHIISIQQENN